MSPPPIHAMLLELARFDTVNLAYGIAAGDHALREIGRRILFFASDEFEGGDWLVARMGGGQFLIAAAAPCSRDRWQWLAEALGDAVAHPVHATGAEGDLRLSPRLALMRAGANDGVDMLFERLSETALTLRERREGRILWADGNVPVPGRRGALLEADLLSALDRGEIAVLFQPQYRIGREWARHDRRRGGIGAVAASDFGPDRRRYAVRGGGTGRLCGAIVAPDCGNRAGAGWRMGWRCQAVAQYHARRSRNRQFCRCVRIAAGAKRLSRRPADAGDYGTGSAVRSRAGRPRR